MLDFSQEKECLGGNSNQCVGRCDETAWGKAGILNMKGAEQLLLAVGEVNAMLTLLYGHATWALVR